MSLLSLFVLVGLVMLALSTAIVVDFGSDLLHGDTQLVRTVLRELPYEANGLCIVRWQLRLDGTQHRLGHTQEITEWVSTLRIPSPQRMPRGAGTNQEMCDLPTGASIGTHASRIGSSCAGHPFMTDGQSAVPIEY